MTGRRSAGVRGFRAAAALAAVGGVTGATVVAAGALTGGVGTLTVPDTRAVELYRSAEVVTVDPAADHARVDPAWFAATARTSGVPGVALRAYAAAALTVADEQPQCHLGWTTLAGIGEVESGHGTHGGTSLGADGRPRTPIIGPALDGREGFATIASDPESAARHGDTRWDHAVGPFQFIGSTWARWQADGDGDAVADPQDVDDAALAAGRYLCASGADLRTGEGWTRAVHSYNHSDEYVAAVLAAASRYAG